MKRSRFQSVLMIGFFLLLAGYGAAPLILPSPVSVSVQTDRFSAERAMQYVRELAKTPRQAGSEGMDRAAEYLVRMLQACGLEAEIQSTSSQPLELQNVVARIPGRQSSGALLILSHPESISYGAGDNASGAAVLLQTACALKAGTPLRNDILFLFDDGEEQGYLGGYAFTSSHPWMPDIKRVIGLDTAAWGPAILLQTTPGNASLIDAYAASALNPNAHGFFAAADWTISKDTSEIQPFYEQGISGLALEDPTAFTGKHSADDTVEKIRPGSLQQMGDQVLTLARYLGDANLDGPTNTDQGYFTLWGLGVIHYPARWNLVFTILGALGWIALTVRMLQQRQCTVPILAFASGLHLLILIAALGVGLAGTIVFSKLFPNPNPHTGSYLVPSSLPAFLAIEFIVILGSFYLHQKFADRFRSPTWILAGLLPWLLLAIASSALIPVGSYMFTIPLLAAILVRWISFHAKWLWILPVAIAVILFIPNIVLAFLGTGLETLALVTFLTALITPLWVEGNSFLPSR